MRLRHLIKKLEPKFSSIDEILNTTIPNGSYLNLNLYGLYLLIIDDNFRLSFFQSQKIHIDGIGASILIFLCTKRWFSAVGYRQWGYRIFKKFENRTILMIGGTQTESLNALANISFEFPSNTFHALNGYLDTNSYYELINHFPNSIVIVGMGMPNQEVFITTAIQKGYSNTFFACGGWIKQLAKHEKPVPCIFKAFKLEWLYRSLRRPGHFRTRVFLPLLCIIKNY